MGSVCQQTRDLYENSLQTAQEMEISAEKSS